MDLLYTVLVTLVTLGILVAVHEFGHFWVARRCGVKVLRFSIGFGKALWRRTARDGTEYVIAAVPLGGYVKMLDEREGPVAQEELAFSFNRKPVSARMAIVAAGPAANFVLAIVAFYVLYMIGVPGLAPVIGDIAPGSVAEAAGLERGQEIIAVDGEPTPTRQAVAMQLLKRLGESGEIRFSVRYPQTQAGLTYESSARIEDWLMGEDEPDLLGGLGISYLIPEVPARVAEVVAGSPAERAGMRAGDLIVAVDGEAVASWEAWVGMVRANPGTALAVEVEREQARVMLRVTPAGVQQKDGSRTGQVGVSVAEPQWPPEMLRVDRYGPLAAWRPALAQTWSLAVFTVDSVKKMFEGLISPKNLSGPITIAKVATDSARSGLESYISFLALLSISLGVLNLFPIPVLDGGHLVYYLIEMIKGSPVSERAQMLGYQVGLVILVGVMLLAFYNDINRLAAN
ncbi:MAG: sigma E protease regulator RseP [Gammaproteobacteria bacterium]|nr:sigma E protease regulator RseP [Gammaproteobacteria bacterium]